MNYAIVYRFFYWLTFAVGVAIGITASAQHIPAGSLSTTGPDADTIVGRAFTSDYDTIFIVNEILLDAYQECRANIAQLKEEALKIDSAIANLDSLDVRTRQLVSSLHSLEASYEKFLAQNVADVDRLRALNEDMALKLSEATSELEEVRKQISRARWRSVATKVVWGLGGCAVGVLAGTILISQ